MNTEVVMPSFLRAALLPPTRPLVRTHLLQIAGLMGGQAAIEPQAMGACVVLPYCGVLLVGTACRAPLLQPEADVAATVTGMTVLLLRVEVDHGMSVDIKLAGQSGLLCNYRLEHGTNGLSLVPPQEGQPRLCLAADGVTADTSYPCTASMLVRSEGGNV